MDIILLAIMAIAAYILLSGIMPAGGGAAAGSSSSRPSAATTGNTSPEKVSERDAKNYALCDAVSKGNIVANEKGIILADSIYKGSASISRDAQVSNILTRYGTSGVTLQDTGNPLEVAYTYGINITGTLPAGIRTNEMNLSQTYVSARRPANEEESEAARRANMEAIAKLDPSYKQTVAYQSVMGSG